MATPYNSVQDNFNRADENPLASANWDVDRFGASTGHKIVGNQAVPINTAVFAQSGFKTPYGYNQEVFLTLAALQNDNKSVEIFYRAPAAATSDNYYRLFATRVAAGNDFLTLGKVVSTVYTQIGAGFDLGGDFTVNDQLWVTVSGELHSIYLNGTAQFTRTDNDVPTGRYIGFGNDDAIGAVAFDDFGGGTIYAGTGPFTVGQSTVGGTDVIGGVAAASLSATVNQASETDTAQPITVNPKRRLVNQTVESDLAQALTRTKLKALGQPAETDLAQPIRAIKTRAVGQTTEADIAQPVTHLKLKAILQATETDLSQALTHSKVRGVGQVAETDTAALVSVNPQRRLVGQIAETDLAQSVTHAKVKALSQPTETDLAQAITSNKTRPLGQTTETETAQAVVHQKQKAIGQANETDTAQALTRLKTKLLGLTVETNLAQPVTRPGGYTIAVNQAVETDLSQPVAVNPMRRLMGQAVESETAQLVGPLKRKTLGQASEGDTASPLSARKLLIVNLVSETELAQPLSARKIRGVALASESDLAQALAKLKHKAIGQAQETDLAQTITSAVMLVGYIRIVNLSGRLPTGRAITGQLPHAGTVTGRLSTAESCTGSLASIGAIDGRLPTATDLTGVL